MSHARVAPPSSLPARLFGGLLLGGALVLAAGQLAHAGPAGGERASTPPAPACHESCPMHAGMPDAGHGAHPGHHKPGKAGGAGHGAHPGLPFAGPGFDRMLDDIQATPEQRQQIRAITDQARKDLRALHEQGRAQHHGAMALWTSPKLDAAEAEKQRQQVLAHHDQVSKRVTQAMLDVGRVLTPEQRAQAAAQLKERHERMQDRRAQREQAREARGERLQNHMLRRPAAASAPAPATASAPSR